VILDCTYQQGHTQIRTNEGSASVWFFFFFFPRTIFELWPKSQSNLPLKHVHSPGESWSDSWASASSGNSHRNVDDLVGVHMPQLKHLETSTYFPYRSMRIVNKMEGGLKYSFCNIQVQCMYRFGLCFVFKYTQLRYPQLHINLS